MAEGTQVGSVGFVGLGSMGSAVVDPRATTSRPDSSSLRKRTSSMSSRIWPTSACACSMRASRSEFGSEADSRSARSLASGLRSSWETEAVKPARSSS